MESKTSHRKLKRLQRQRKAWELRLAGTTITDIARQLGVSMAQASKDVSEAFAAYREQCEQEKTEMARLDLARLDKLIESYWSEATAGNPQAAKIVISLLRQREHILGYGQPTKSEIKVTGAVPPEELPKLQEELLNRLKALPPAEQTRLEPEKGAE